jgi:hypothetical protein
MPNISLVALQPTLPLHWTSIMHYLVLLGMAYLLLTSGDKTPLLFIIILGFAALTVGVSLYSDKISIPRLFIFLARVVMTGIPIMLAGMSPTENTRSAAILVAILAAPLLAIAFFTCIFGGPPIGDPRIVSWCGQ